MTTRVDNWQWLMWKTLLRKNDASVRVPHAIAHQERNKPDFWWPTLSKFLNVAGIFWSCFLLDTACISKEDFLSNAGIGLALDGGQALEIKRFL